MLNIQFYQFENIIDGLLFILSFLIIMKKIGYEYKPKNMFLKIINLLLMFLVIRVQMVTYGLDKGIIISVVLLFIICKISYSFDFKKAFLYSILYTSIYRGVEISLEYIILYIYLLIKDKLNLEWNMVFDVS